MTVQAPSALIVTVPVGVTVQTTVVVLAKVTGSLLVAVATRLNGAAPIATSAGWLKVMVCAATAFGGVGRRLGAATAFETATSSSTAERNPTRINDAYRASWRFMT